MKLLLIFPMGKGRMMGKHSHFKLAPLTLPHIAGLTPGDVDIQIIDELVDEVDFDADVDLVGLSVLTPLAPRAYEIADRFRKRGIKVVLGGVHITMCPQEAALHADALVLGEAEETWPKLIEDFKKGRLQKIYRCLRPPDLKGLPLPRWDLLKMRYLPTYIVQTTRGCPFDCEFCAVTTFFGGKYRTRPIEEVVNEIKTLIESKRQRSPLGDIFFFTDDNIFSNPSYTKEWLKEITPFKIKWLCQAPITMAWDEELLKISAESGCIGALIGFETLSQKNIDKMGKKINRVKEYEEAIKRIHSYGIKMIGSFMFGLDDDNKEIFERVVRFMEKNHIDVPG
ncbi:B12-binding domain-containing radical SAM protein, partial [bacterium]|nr:B12-binding domain-containing radical SAM protein [bacterium]